VFFSLVAEILARDLPVQISPNGQDNADHCHGLDMLRGLAALGVLWFHCAERLNLPLLFPHGYLAVDFFFVLSGFVIARAYHMRLATRHLTLLRFALIRAIRLMPLIIFGTIAGAGLEILRLDIPDRHQHSIDTAQAALLGSLLVPMLQPTTLAFFVFPLNAPVWSLFFEALANAAFAGWARTRLHLIVLTPVLGISALGLLWGAYLYGNVELGSSPNKFWLGFARVGWSFAAGMILFGIRDYAPRIPFAFPAILLITILLAPISNTLNQAFDLICVFFVLPWIVWSASSARFGHAGQRLSSLSGELSYPVYALHTFLSRFVVAVGTVFYSSLAGRISIAIAATAVVLLVSALTLAYFDMPVRKWLTAKLAALPSRSNLTAEHAV
jgi:peptidoglycan/LPS O-acetylase OafA/YrhL